MMRACNLFLLCFLPLLMPGAELVWPTPNRAYLEGRGLEEFIQATASGEVQSGLFGGVRSGGRQFHGGLDLKPVSRDRRGEALDAVFAAMPGVVRYVNKVAGNSSYGRYIVIEHTGVKPQVLTLYAHLGAVEDGVAPGVTVVAGQRIGTMGRSAGGYVIPKSRSHLHFEIGLWLSRDFQRWYDTQKYQSPNKHGVWNGLNMVRVNPLAFYDQYRSRQISSMLDYFRGLEEVVRLRIATRKTPDFIQRYPELKVGGVVFDQQGWEISFDWTGVPFAWRALGAADLGGFKSGEQRIVAVNWEAIRRERSKSMVLERKGGVVPGKDLMTVLERLFLVQ